MRPRRRAAHRRPGCVFVGGEQNRSAVGKSLATLPSRRPQRFGLRRCLSRDEASCYAPARVRSGVRSAAFLPRRGRRARPPGRPSCPAIQSPLKAKAVPVAASSSDFVSARPTRPEVRPRSPTAMRIQDSADGAVEVGARTMAGGSDRHVVRGPFLRTPPSLVVDLRRGHVPVPEQ